MKLAGAIALVSVLGASEAFFTAPAPRTRCHMVRMGASPEDSWRDIVGSEANLRKYLGDNGFRYCLNKTPQEVAKEGELGFLEKMFGATSNNAARLAAKASARAVTIDQYDPKKAEENKEWMARFGHRRWGMSYLDKSAFEQEQQFKPQPAPPAPTAAEEAEVEANVSAKELEFSEF